MCIGAKNQAGGHDTGLPPASWLLRAGLARQRGRAPPYLCCCCPRRHAAAQPLRLLLAHGQSPAGGGLGGGGAPAPDAGGAPVRAAGDRWGQCRRCARDSCHDAACWEGGRGAQALEAAETNAKLRVVGEGPSGVATRTVNDPGQRMGGALGPAVWGAASELRAALGRVGRAATRGPPAAPGDHLRSLQAAQRRGRRPGSSASTRAVRQPVRSAPCSGERGDRAPGTLQQPRRRPQTSPARC